MTDEQTDDFDWGSLGEQYWRDIGARCKASELQIRFACAKHAGATNTGAAKLAGYKGDADAIRQAGYGAFRGTKVSQMLAIAASEDKAPVASILTKEDRAKRLSELVSSPDPTLRIRAIEALNKMEEREAGLGQAMDEDGFSSWRWIRDLLRMSGGGPAALSLYCGDAGCISNMPLLHDVYQAVMREAPEFWEHVASRFQLPGRLRLKKYLDGPAYQIWARQKLWREVGVEIDVPLGVTVEEPKSPSAQMNATMNGEPR
jgi:hypothetical protein